MLAAMTRQAGRVRVSVTAAPLTAVLVTLVTMLSGCGGGPTRVGPTGVDELVIPTPSPDPGDFADTVDNPYFPLPPGAIWHYRRYGAGGRDETVRVLDGRRSVDGVSTVRVSDLVVSASGRAVASYERWYAQDRAGNVWWFGQHVTGAVGPDVTATRSWQAGVDGAEAGLVMPAAPRVGDGFVQGSAAGAMAARSTVQTAGLPVEVPGHRRVAGVVVRDQSPLVPGRLVESIYASGFGLVTRQTLNGLGDLVTLVSLQRP